MKLVPHIERKYNTRPVKEIIRIFLIKGKKMMRENRKKRGNWLLLK